ncbi:MAG: hypothetical protein J0H09_29355 [Burkholderiales bacterium]|nr:hypothetical protein [Burkholderiales bacterium]
MANRTNIEPLHTVTQAFLALLDRDIQAGINVRPLPEDLAQFMEAQAQLCPDVDLDEKFEGDIDL